MRHWFGQGKSIPAFKVRSNLRTALQHEKLAVGKIVDPGVGGEPTPNFRALFFVTVRIILIS